MMKTTKICKRVKKIPLTQGKFALVDAEDYEYLMQWKWYYAKVGYAATNSYATGNRQILYMHRVILERMRYRGFDRSDHINRDRLDNRRCNLRPATNSQSICNQGRRKDNRSGYVGVGWHKQNKKWRVRVRLNGKEVHLGLFDDKKEAACVYNTAARMYHGEFAKLNEV